MNERWMRVVYHALLLLLLPAMGACTVGRLSDRIVIDAGTRVTDQEGETIDVGGTRMRKVGDKEVIEKDFLTTRNLADEGGLKLQPGDLLTYTRWSPGFASATDAVSFQTHEPTSDRHTIALRLISPSGRLHPSEERFLGTILATQRQVWTESFPSDLSGRVDSLREVLDRNQINLWNELVQNISLVRVQSTFPTSGRLSQVLVATIKMQALCRSLDTTPGSIDAELFAKAFINPTSRDCETQEGTTKELSNLPELALSPLYVASSSGPASDEINGYFITGNGSYVQFNFTEVERNGVRVDQRDGPAAKWTLREWEDSGICEDRDSDDKPVIRRIRLTSGRRKIWIHRDSNDPSPTYHLQVRLTKDTTRRWIERISERYAFEEEAVLDASALDVLRMSDLDFVEWGSPSVVGRGHRREAVDVRPNGCRFLGAD